MSLEVTAKGPDDRSPGIVAGGVNNIDLVHEKEISVGITGHGYRHDDYRHGGLAG